jgi:glycosyltransferase involved in cell wall biosynthesis
VIPTVGRSTLRSAVDSIRRQTIQPMEIVIVNDSAEQLSVTSGLGENVFEEFTGGLRGPSAARNQGLDRTQSELVAYLDDDDTWFPHHLASALESFQMIPKLDLYACSMIQAQTTGFVTHSPKVAFSRRQSLVDFFYGRYCWASRRRSIPVSTWVFRRETCDLPMDENLAVREDLWLLLNLDNQGRVLRQSPNPGGVWYEDPTRTLGRDSADVAIDWSRRIETLSPGAGQRFIMGVMGRNYVRKGMRDEWVDLIQRMPPEWRISWDYRLIGTIENLALRQQRRIGLGKLRE